MRTITLIALLLVAPAAYANDPAKTETATTAKPAKLTADDLQVLAHYHELNRKEIDLGKYVVRVSKNKAVKEYAQMLIKDHGDADKKLLAMAKARGAKIPMEKARTDAEKAEKAEGKKQVAAIKKLKGAELDAKYIDAMVTGHEKELALVDTKAGEATDPAVAEMARGKRETLQKHADHAREIQKTLGQGQASASSSTPSTTARR